MPPRRARRALPRGWNTRSSPSFSTSGSPMCLMPSRSFSRKMSPAFTYWPWMMMSSGSFTMMMLPEAHDEPARHVVDQGRAERIAWSGKLADRVQRSMSGASRFEKAPTARPGRARPGSAPGGALPTPWPRSSPGSRRCTARRPPGSRVMWPISPGQALRPPHQLAVRHDP